MPERFRDAQITAKSVAAAPSFLGCGIRTGRQTVDPPAFPPFLLLTQTQLRNQCAIAVDVLFRKIAQHIPSFTDHLQQTAVAVVVLRVKFAVGGQVVDPFGQDRNLYLRRAGVVFMLFVCKNNPISLRERLKSFFFISFLGGDP